MEASTAQTTSANSDSEVCLTLTTSVFLEPDAYNHNPSNLPSDAIVPYIRSFPQPGKKSIIRDPKTGFIALKRGVLRLHSEQLSGWPTLSLSFILRINVLESSGSDHSIYVQTSRYSLPINYSGRRAVYGFFAA